MTSIVYNALQIKKGAKAEYNRMGTLTQPIQFLPKSEKDESWSAWNMDWFEMQGLKQIRRNAKKLLKNYKLANGIIDKTDYIVEDDNNYSELIDVLTKEDVTALELKFFPIIPNIINVLTGEFSKRSDKILYRAVDDTSYNEMLESKRQMIEEVLVSQAEQTMLGQMQDMGIKPDSEQGKQMMSPENIKSLPQIEEFFRKKYRGIGEEWATHQHHVDSERFKIKELETLAFKDMLITDREFWHFKMNEDDYDLELWNPVTTFYHKSPDVRYISQGNWVGKIDLMGVADVIDKYGYKMDQEQLKSLEAIYPIKAAGYPILGQQNDGSFYDATRSHEWNTTGPSLAMRQFMSVSDTFLSAGDDIITRIFAEGEDLFDYGTLTLLRVTTLYWKSQRMVGHLTKIDESGMIVDMIVDEDFQVTVKPVYDTLLLKKKSRETLSYGEHIEWIWINQVWGGVKIGPNRPSFYGVNDASGVTPIYLDIRPVRFQFKGDFTIYGAKLPVEGAVFSDRNTKSTCTVDKLKPFQIGYNLVNNQIADILIDELGTVIVLDQNALPKSSMGEDWGPNNFSKAYVAMKDFQMLPLDTSLANTENAVNFQHYQTLNLEQTQRLLSRVNLSQYFKQQAFETIGISPQRLGAVSAQETATGVEQAIVMSYAQTDMLFVQHCEHLMPRVHQMRTDLAQYYNSNNPSLRLSYMTSKDEQVNFTMNGTELLLRDFNVYCTTKINHKQLTEQIKQLAMSNNTAGASIFDLGNLLAAESLSEINGVLKYIEDKNTNIRQQEMQHEKDIETQKAAAEQKIIEEKQKFEAEQNALDRQNRLDEAELKGAGYQTGDLNKNNQSDYLDTLKYLDDKRATEEDINLKKEKLAHEKGIDNQSIDLKRQELISRERIADKALQVAKENRNKYDKKSTKKK